MTAETAAAPLVILGLDAGDHRFIERWAREGHLSTIASLMDRGCWGKTAGPELLSEHGVWVAVFSGLSRGQHGYYHFRQLGPGTYDLENVTGRDIQAPPFWSHLAGSGKKLAIVDAPDVHPRRGIDGVQLANWAGHSWAPGDPAFRVSAEPPGVLRDVRRVVGPPIRLREDLHASVRQDRRFYRRLLRRIERKGAVCRYLLGRDHFDLVVAVFTESHWAGHQFWRYRPEVLPADAPPGAVELAYATRNVYRAIDRQLGLLLAMLPARANVFVVSSVGMEDHYPTGGLVEALCRRLGYQATPDTASGPWTPLALARRALPETLRIALSRRLPRDARERLLADQFRRGTDWAGTTAFAIPSAFTSFLRINLEGREPRGLVHPGAQYRALLDRLEADLYQLVDPQTGDAAVKDVARSERVFGTVPERLPDLFVKWAASPRFVPRLVHPQAELVQQKPEFYRGSDHSEHGFIAAAGPAIQARGAIDDVALLDLAPTFLTLLGQPVPRMLSGTPLAGIALDERV